MSTEANQRNAPPQRSPRERDNAYYRLLAGGARTRLLETFLDLHIPELLGKQGAMSARKICEWLELDPQRGWKLLHLLAMNGLLTESGGERGSDDAVFDLSDEAREYFGANGTEGYFFRDLVNFWRAVAVLPTVDVVRGMHLPDPVRWPPPDPSAAEHLETWMRVTAQGAISTIINSGVMAGAKRLLDIGGGDGTIGCALVRQYPGLNVTVFNLPASANIAQRVIAGQGCGDRVSVHEGDFLADEFPKGFDRIMFSRVLTDWEPKVCLMLLQKSRRAIREDGRLVINEALVEGNEDYALAWEFRYLFYDTFGRAMFKPLLVYEDLLREAGFKIEKVSPPTDEAFYSVIQARPL